jgi:hypothetical protein
MKKTLTTIFIISLIFGCSKDEDSPKPMSTSINKIMILGASRVEGSRPDYESFRFNLWKNMIENNWTFDFIGTQSDEASYPPFNSFDFDIDHEGRGGWTSGQILDGIGDWLTETGPPDIVLFSSPGGNDALEQLSYSEAVSNINSIIDVIQSSNPNCIIIIEQMAPGHSEIMTTELTNFWNQMQEEVLDMAENKTTINSQVIAIDMFTGFGDNFLADDVHYNEDGAEFIADRYYKTIINLLD